MTILQHTPTSGMVPAGLPLFEAAVLLLREHGVNLDSTHLREGLPIQNGEPTEPLLKRALARIGYEAVDREDKSVSDLSYPCAIALCAGGYLVVLRADRDALLILDGGNTKAIRKVPIDQVQENYARRSFQVLPSVDLLLNIHSIGDERRHWFWGRLFLERRSLADVIIASLFANLLAVVTSMFALQVYDRVIPSQSQPTLWVLASGVGLAILFEAMLRVSRARLIDQVGKEAEIEITSDIFSRTLGMRLDKRPASPGAIVHMVREFSAVKEFFTNAAVGVVADLPFAFIFLLLIYGIAGNVAWIILVGAILIVLPNIAFQGRMARLSKESMGGMSSASRLLTEAAYGLETVKTTRAEPMFQRQWEEIIALNASKTTEQRSLRAFLTYWATSVQQATYIFAIIACVYMIFEGLTTTGAIIAIGILTTRTLSPIAQLSQTISTWQNMRTALTALEAVMSSEQERSLERTYIQRPRLVGRATFDKVKFAYPGTKRTALDVAMLDVPAGTRLALLGANGSGKSTFLRLAAGLHQPNEGEVLIDGLDMRQIDPADLRRNIGYLPQEIQLFRGSLADNLSSGSQFASREAMLEALAFAGLADFVRHYPEGLDLKIADGGAGLSIGQRQSIGLARLYLQDPAIVLLDEPTAALDGNLENIIVSRLGKWIASRTCIVATHRPQILAEMTHVTVLQQGRVILSGDRDSTLKKMMGSPPLGKSVDTK